MDRYGNDFDQYIQSKFRITENQNSEDILIYNYDDENIRNRIKTKRKRFHLVYIKHFLREPFYKEKNKY